MLTLASFVSDVALRQQYEDMVVKAAGSTVAEILRSAGAAGAGGSRSGAVKTKRTAAEVSDEALALSNVNKHIESVLRDSRQLREDALLLDPDDAFSQRTATQSIAGAASCDVVASTHSSKRAKLALQTIKAEQLRSRENEQRTHGQIKPSSAASAADLVRDKWERMEQLQLSRPVVTDAIRNRLALSSSTNNKLNRFCAVCRNKAERPCGNKSCGHICCETCWVQWLKKSSTCPHCRAPADRNTVTLLTTR